MISLKGIIVVLIILHKNNNLFIISAISCLSVGCTFVLRVLRGIIHFQLACMVLFAGNFMMIFLLLFL